MESFSCNMQDACARAVVLKAAGCGRRQTARCDERASRCAVCVCHTCFNPVKCRPAGPRMAFTRRNPHTVCHTCFKPVNRRHAWPPMAFTCCNPHTICHTCSKPVNRRPAGPPMAVPLCKPHTVGPWYSRPVHCPPATGQAGQLLHTQ
eukprot:200537-Chlamydomonas_euryale.AAC.2